MRTVQIHLKRIKQGRFEKSEINALTKFLGSYRFASPERKNEILDLQADLLECVGHEYISSSFQCDVMHFKKPCKITKEQTKLGKAWLKHHFFKLSGEKRGSKNAEHVSDRVLAISKSVSRFEFVGVLMVRNQWADLLQALPIYRTYNRKGEYFDYSPIHWGQPIIMENY